MKLKILLLTIALTCFSCNNDDDDNESKLPECFQAFVDLSLSAPPTTPRATITKYLYKGEDI